MDEELRRELKTLEKRKQHSRSVGDIVEEAKLCNYAGELLSQHRLYEQAIEQHKMELHLSEIIKDTMGIAISHRKIGECLSECNDLENALFHQEKYLELSRKASCLIEEQRAQATLGRFWLQHGKTQSDFLKAQSALLESLSICDQLWETVKEKELLEMRARLYLNLGLVYDNLNNKRKGRKYIEKALEIAVNQSLKDTEYRCYISLGDLTLSDDRPAEALKLFDRARKVAQHQKKKFEEADTLVIMGQILLSLGDLKSGKKILKQCLKMTKKTEDDPVLRSSLLRAIKGTKLLLEIECYQDNNDMLLGLYEDLGDIFSKLKCFSKAVQYYHEQLIVAEKLDKSNEEKAVICFSIAMSYQDDKDYEKAKTYFMKELELRRGNFAQQSITWRNIARITELLNENYEVIEEVYEKALECAKQTGKPEEQIELLKMLAKLQKKHSKNEQETLNKLSLLGECKVEQEDSEEFSEDVEDMEGSEMNDEEAERLIEEELALSDKDSDDDAEDDSRPVFNGQAKKRKSKLINKRNEKGETVLHCAAIRGDYNLAKTSIEKGVSVLSRDYCGWQPLHEACNHGNADIVTLLLDHGADINDPGGPHCRGMTPLHDATQNGHIHVVRLLIERGADANIKNKDGDTPLDMVLGAISSDMDDPDDPPSLEIINLRHKLKTLLKTAMQRSSQTRRQENEAIEMRRRDQFDFSDADSENDSASQLQQHTFTSEENSENFTRNVSRKRKSAPVDLESDGESQESRVSKSCRVSRNIEEHVSDMEDEHSRELWEDSNDVTENPEEMSPEPVSNINQDSQISESNTLSVSSDSPSPVRYRPMRSRAPAGGTKRPDKLANPRQSLISVNAITTSHGQNSTSSTTSHGQNSTSSTTSHGQNSTSSTTSHGQSRTHHDHINLDPLSGRTGQASRGSTSPALIPEEDYLDGGDWLIDDVGRKRSKRKGDIRSLLQQPSQNSRTRTNRKPHGIKKHTNLRQSRISNHVVDTSSIVDNEVVVNHTIPDTTTSTTITGSTITPHAGVTPIRFRVKVKDRTFLIPCTESNGEQKTVKWLADQATLRYYTACGLKPVLTLSTSEGAVLSSHDLITTVLSNNEQVCATVENWDLPPVAIRYQNACLNSNTDVSQPIFNLLETNAHISTVELSEMCLTPVEFLPLFRALQCHDQLVQLSLPGNRMGDNGFQHLISALPRLPNLTILGISCNNITHKGLRMLASSLTEDTQTSQIWMGIKELDLSYNSIKDLCAQSLARILSCSLLLQKLNVQSCGLTENTFHQRSLVTEALSGLTRLRYLTVAYNSITSHGLRTILESLSKSPIQHLDISYTTHKREQTFAEVLGEYLNRENWCIQELSCQSCCLKDTDIAQLVASSCFLRSITKLDLSMNDIGQIGCAEIEKALRFSRTTKELNLSGNVDIKNENFLHFMTAPVLKNIRSLNLSTCGLCSPFPVAELKKKTTQFSVENTLKILNLSHNILNAEDKDRLADFWKTIWQDRSQICLNNTIMMFTVNSSLK